MTPPRPLDDSDVEVPRLRTQDMTLAYDRRVVVNDLTWAVPNGGLTVIIGPNACGKSTLLRALARLLAPRSGQVLLDGRAITQQDTVDVARRLGLLPQNSTVPTGIRVVDLVCRGRFAHQRFLRRWNAEDTSAVEVAMADTGIAHLAERPVDELSGGQRQRAWLAAVLAQDTPLLLLDEPTTFLDVCHQLEVMELCGRLHSAGRTIVAVLHDLNQAARHATHVVAMRNGTVVAEGPPGDVITPALLADVFGIEARIVTDPLTGGPLVVPIRPLVTP